MTPVDQTILDLGRGDCHRACIASILDLPITAVPNFVEHGERWHELRWSFMCFMGWEFAGTVYDKLDHRVKYNINGYLIASVKSKNFENARHSVVMDVNGLCVHDPSPHKQYQGVMLKDNPDFEDHSMWEPFINET